MKKNAKQIPKASFKKKLAEDSTSLSKSDSNKTSKNSESLKDKKFGIFLIVAAGIAWIASSILFLERLALYENPNYVTSCDFNPLVSCGTIMKSTQASLFGFPNPLLGIVGFAILVSIGAALLAGAKFARWYWVSLQVGITLAMTFVVWLWSQALFEINALCLYCMIVWAMMIPLFIHTTAKNISTGVIPSSLSVKLFVKEWAWVITTILILLTAASVLFNFPQAFFKI